MDIHRASKVRCLTSKGFFRRRGTGDREQHEQQRTRLRQFSRAFKSIVVIFTYILKKQRYINTIASYVFKVLYLNDHFWRVVYLQMIIFEILLNMYTWNKNLVFTCIQGRVYLLLHEWWLTKSTFPRVHVATKNCTNSYLENM